MARFASLLLLALSGAASARSNSAFVPKRALELRGGAGPLDAAQVGKAATVLATAQGAYSVLAPGKVLDFYGVKKSAINEVVSRRIGAACLTIGITGIALLYKDASLDTAVGLGALVWLAEYAKSLLNDEPAKV